MRAQGWTSATGSKAASVLLAVGVLAGCAIGDDGRQAAGSAQAQAAAGEGTSGGHGTPTGSRTATTSRDAVAPSSGGPAERAAADRGSTPTSASQDEVAGVLSHDVPQVGTGQLVTVPGTSSAPGSGTLRRIRVSVEAGLPVDGLAFAGFVQQTLNDPRSWAHDGYVFARTDGEFDTEVVLASPQTSKDLCRPLDTMGTLSCRNGSRVVLTWYRWVNGQEDFGDNLTAYRQYLVNHEVGHSLGHGHADCPGPGQVAPVMMQQTKGVKPCVPNAWPYP